MQKSSQKKTQGHDGDAKNTKDEKGMDVAKPLRGLWNKKDGVEENKSKTI